MPNADLISSAVTKGFGKGSLEVMVQAWTDQEYDASQAVTSELGLALHRSLRAAGIALP